METIAAYLNGHLMPCISVSWLGIECPGCGMQRALIALLKGDFILSLKFNASLLPFLLTFFYSALHLFIGFKNGARNIVWCFGFTIAVMLVNFVIKIISPA